MTSPTWGMRSKCFSSTVEEKTCACTRESFVREVSVCTQANYKYRHVTRFRMFGVFFVSLMYFLNLPLRDISVSFKATQRLSLQLDLLPERAAGGAPEFLLRVQTQKRLPTRWQARTLWLYLCGGGISLLQVRYSALKVHQGLKWLTPVSLSITEDTEAHNFACRYSLLLPILKGTCNLRKNHSFFFVC